MKGNLIGWRMLCLENVNFVSNESLHLKKKWLWVDFWDLLLFLQVKDKEHRMHPHWKTTDSCLKMKWRKGHQMQHLWISWWTRPSHWDAKKSSKSSLLWNACWNAGQRFSENSRYINKCIQFRWNKTYRSDKQACCLYQNIVVISMYCCVCFVFSS